MTLADNMPNDRPQDQSRRITALEAAVRELRAARNLDRATITPDAGLGIRTGDFDGTNFANPGTAGNYFGGDGAVLNSLYLRPGSIGNDVLTNPISGDVRNSSGSGFALTPSMVELAGADMVVPSGFATLVITAGATVFSYNPNTTGGSNGAGGDALYSMVSVGSQQSHQNPVGVSGNGGYATSFSAAGFKFTGLTAGSTLRLSCFGSSAYANLAANTNNYANVYASLIWLR